MSGHNRDNRSDIPKFPSAEIFLEEGNEGNAFGILGQAQRALKKSGASESIISDYMTEATSGDYANLLRVTKKWVTVIYKKWVTVED